jgi:hypothetical protein
LKVVPLVHEASIDTTLFGILTLWQSVNVEASEGCYST